MNHRNIRLQIWGDLDGPSRSYWMHQLMHKIGRNVSKFHVRYVFDECDIYKYIEYEWIGPGLHKEVTTDDLEVVPEL